ncbi:hypothetical protein [Streptomyces sp. NPDC006193]|uniref:hypothetical protein n=1 Tax=Streptomyces sp. NPDC006193 TaxID=3155717 RepID=UPI0033A47242
MLALTACGGGGSGAGHRPSAAPGTATAAPARTASPVLTGAAAELQGSWVTTGKGAIVALVVSGGKAGVFATGGTVCSGTADAEDGVRTLRLTCADGSRERTVGRVDSVTAGRLEVTWSGGAGRETYTKAAGGRLPSAPATHTIR